jgi:hypothetical protein
MYCEGVSVCHTSKYESDDLGLSLKTLSKVLNLYNYYGSSKKEISKESSKESC